MVKAISKKFIPQDIGVLNRYSEGMAAKQRKNP
jgi:hypothetical protein